MDEVVGPNGDQARTPLNESQSSQQDTKQEHLEKMTDYKSYAKVVKKKKVDQTYCYMCRVLWILLFCQQMRISCVMLWSSAHLFELS